MAVPPRPLTSFVGRERESDEICSLLRREEVRLVTLTGAGGVGKTRLAIRAADGLAPDFAEVWYVALDAIRDPALVGPAVAQALGLREPGERTVWEHIAEHCGSSPALLVLDNFEQVLPAAREVVGLLMRCPGMKALITSRVVLHASGEFDYPVPPLALPANPSELSLPDLVGAPAIALFLQRAQAASPRFAIDSGNRHDVLEICARLDGVPLAIELAAAHSRLLSPAAMRRRLGDRLALLAGGPHELPARLRSMRDAIGWSHDLLGPTQRTLFRRLAVFVDGFAPEAAEAVCADGEMPAASILLGIEELLDASLLVRDPSDDEPRFRVLETVREYAWERLSSSGESTRIRDAHAAYYLALAEQTEPRLVVEGSRWWLERLVTEWANIREAVTWSLASDRSEAVLGLAGTLLTYGYARGDPEEGRAWLEQALTATPEADPRLRADAHFTASALAQVRGDFDRSTRHCHDAITLARAHGYPFGQARAELALGITAEWGGDLGQAAAHYEAARGLMREIDSGERRAHWAALPTANLADVALLRGEHARAIALAEEAIARWRVDGYVWGIAQALGTAAAAACARGDLTTASRRYQETLDWWLSCEDGRGIAGTLAGIAAVAIARGHLERAGRLLGAAWKVGGAMGVRYLAHHVHAERVLAAARERLDQQTFEACWHAGQRLALVDAVAEARAALDVGEARQPTGPGLTAREAEILRLIAAGRSDREIAAHLRISPRTVQTHVARIFFKLGTGTRAESAALAVRRGFI